MTRGVCLQGVLHVGGLPPGGLPLGGLHLRGLPPGGVCIWGKVCIQGSLHSGRILRHTVNKRGKHPTGMHSCCIYNNISQSFLSFQEITLKFSCCFLQALIVRIHFSGSIFATIMNQLQNNSHKTFIYLNKCPALFCFS